MEHVHWTLYLNSRVIKKNRTEGNGSLDHWNTKIAKATRLIDGNKAFVIICSLFFWTYSTCSHMLKHRNTNTQTWPRSLCPPAVSSNQSHGEYPDCRSERESGGEASLLVSPLVVAGIVIGLVLFLSCITIIVGSLRKDSRLRNPHLRASYGQSAALVLRPAIWCIFSSKCHLGSQQSVERWPRTWSHFELNSVAPCITLLRLSDCKISGSLILDISLVGASYNWWNTPTHLSCILLWNSLHPQYRAQYSLPKSLAGFPRECKYFKALSKY